LICIQSSTRSKWPKPHRTSRLPQIECLEWLVHSHYARFWQWLPWY
jgi:hypothetical protein